jgi:hypothetical protein
MARLHQEQIHHNFRQEEVGEGLERFLLKLKFRKKEVKNLMMEVVEVDPDDIPVVLSLFLSKV